MRLESASGDNQKKWRAERDGVPSAALVPMVSSDSNGMRMQIWRIWLQYLVPLNQLIIVSSTSVFWKDLNSLCTLHLKWITETWGKKERTKFRDGGFPCPLRGTLGRWRVSKCNKRRRRSSNQHSGSSAAYWRGGLGVEPISHSSPSNPVFKVVRGKHQQLHQSPEFNSKRLQNTCLNTTCRWVRSFTRTN